MSNITVSDLIRYPLKSCKGSRLEAFSVGPLGFQYDRQWALFGEDGQVITGRQHPRLLDLNVVFEGEHIKILLDDRVKILWPINEINELKEVQIFSNDVRGKHVSKTADDWFSNYLGQKCTLLKTDPSIHRPVLTRHGGQEGDEVLFADQAPILLISEASLSDLNDRLDTPITMARFRPNIVLTGPDPYDEDSWNKIKIGACSFDVLQRCERCVFTTIDPVTKQKHPQKEPLRTLAVYRKVESGGVIFGVHLIARGTGTIQLGDTVEIIK